MCFLFVSIASYKRSKFLSWFVTEHLAHFDTYISYDTNVVKWAKIVGGPTEKFFVGFNCTTNSWTIQRYAISSDCLI